MPVDTFDGADPRCRHCLGPYRGEGFDHDYVLDHDYEPITHNISVTWVSRWEVSCLCGWRKLRGIDSKLTAELVAWIHLRRLDQNAAAEFAHNRGLTELAYDHR